VQHIESRIPRGDDNPLLSERHHYRHPHHLDSFHHQHHHLSLIELRRHYRHPHHLELLIKFEVTASLPSSSSSGLLPPPASFPPPVPSSVSHRVELRRYYRHPHHLELLIKFEGQSDDVGSTVKSLKQLSAVDELTVLTERKTSSKGTTCSVL